ncbi:hypothetical protein MKUB_30360 [Mycobacterium kubicae]|uniref:Uncharacterized protein n=1 Tax=Mycobacterium kubicae TaxID=120959 RepID=A0AAX1J9F3_9MYCO|nr:hypothetical protein [Mycobacterium kubicae]MCV7094289.1 hypothetical protein [Mycobacterium kubicae]ORV98943.1 hypothetical protein AWC13_12125 [Mycobacterium kubicae]QNI09908.1 hypothetical protein GAN18_00505 [Mycobacterium kubicae]QPI38104.1 hypothetical protein I2456_00470 [Mycobacterium kubicae]GFG65546.1 hypothetical protein MKUB_30360 [Mycobacterium kubicae]
MTYTESSRDELSALLLELLLTGQSVDRAGMTPVISKAGFEGMRTIAIEEWMGASPVYTRRMREALGVTTDTVEDIFKIIQLDIGAPAQLLDFRFELEDPYHGVFQLASCGALLDLEPMGEQAVKLMCHDIEDPTFDATAVATNPRARFRPIHRPPRVPADRTPHCAWSVTVEPDREPLPLPAETEPIFRTKAAHVALTDIDSHDEGMSDYSGPLLADLPNNVWSRSAMVRIAEELALQHHLLAISYYLACQRHYGHAAAEDMYRKQFVGIAGFSSLRIKRALGLGDGAQALAHVLQVHPCLNPVQYTGVTVAPLLDSSGVRIVIAPDAPAHSDHSWLTLIDPDHLDAIEAMAVGVDAHFHDLDVTTDTDGTLIVDVRRADQPAKTRKEVAITSYTNGASFAFQDRGIPLPITPINH